MGRLSTHVLDTHSGRPAAGVKIELFALDAGAERL
jgi:5-hydroxyisourate hydrolase-like protein (transthyretin family)